MTEEKPGEILTHPIEPPKLVPVTMFGQRSFVYLKDLNIAELERFAEQCKQEIIKSWSANYNYMETAGIIVTTLNGFKLGDIIKDEYGNVGRIIGLVLPQEVEIELLVDKEDNCYSNINLASFASQEDIENAFEV